MDPTEVTVQKASLEALLQFCLMDNIAHSLSDQELDEIGHKVIRLATQDNSSRSEWLKNSKMAMELALQVAGQRKDFPFDGASNVKFPQLTVAAIQFHARAYPAIVGPNAIVKAHVVGKDESGEKAKSSKRQSDYINYQLLDEMEEWEEQTDKLLLALPIEGCQFKKTYFDSSLGRNVSEWVRPNDLIVANDTKDLNSCPRVTHIVRLYPQQIKERMRMGIWVEADLNLGADDEENQELQEFYEQHCLLDLDEDEYQEPYVVTVHVATGKVVRIKARFWPEDVLLRVGEENISLANIAGLGIGGQTRIAKITPCGYFTKFPFIPSPDGGFYDIGYGQLIGPLSEAVDTIINQSIDAGTLANVAAGFIRPGVTVGGKRGKIKYALGEFKEINIPAGMSIREAVYQFQFRGPNPALLSLMSQLLMSCKDVTATHDIMSGGRETQETATTSTLRVHEATQNFNSIFKRIHRALKEEIRKVCALNAKYLNEETAFNIFGTNDSAVVLRSDFRDFKTVRPVTDSNSATFVKRLSNMQALMALKGDPTINQQELNMRYLGALEEESPEKLMAPPPPPPPPDQKMILEIMKANAQVEKTKAEIAAIYASAIKSISEAEAKEAGVQLQQYKAQLDALTGAIGMQRDEEGRLAAMDAAPGNEEVDGQGQGLRPGGGGARLPGYGEPEPNSSASGLLPGQV